jgi:hypothetical protein
VEPRLDLSIMRMKRLALARCFSEKDIEMRGGRHKYGLRDSAGRASGRIAGKR